MPGKLRIFISSTMEDLENERASIVEQLQSMNFEPVNAEGILPNGATSWDRISEEIETCHAMILLGGIRYGWVPTSGPLAQQNVSVTHGEYLAARAHGLAVLPFFKNLSYKADRTSEDAKRRDSFRSEIEEWEGGQFRSTFTNVVDLSEKVATAVVTMLSDHYQRDLIAKRRTQVESAPPPPPPPPPGNVEPPVHLARSVADGKAILWVGSGISLRAGMPSTDVLTSELVRAIREKAAGYAPPPVGSGIASVTSDFELLHSRELLLVKLRELLDLPGGVSPGEAHCHAVRHFPRIITTNYDHLLEAAAAKEATGHTLIVGPRLPSPPPEKYIWKIHGAVDFPQDLVMSEKDLARFGAPDTGLEAALTDLLKEAPLLVAGTSLRDPSVLRLFRALRPVLDGYWTIIPGDVLGKARAADLRLQPVEGTLESLLAALAQPQV